MRTKGRSPRVRLETKVMVAVLTVLVALPSITLWIVDRHMREQVQRDADLALSTARTSFVQQLKTRNEELMVRFRSGLYDQRIFKILEETNDAATLEAFLQRDVLPEYPDTELVLYVKPDGSLFARARSGGPTGVTFENVAQAADGLIRSSLEGQVASDYVVVSGNVYDVVALPLELPGRRIVGAMVYGIRISDATLSKVQPPGAEVLMIVGNQVSASTLKDASQNDAVLRQLAELAAAGTSGDVRVGGERHRPATGALDPSSAQKGVRYIVLSSVEKRFSSFERTRVTLVGLSAAGILVSAAVVWFFVRRITHPLVELRDSAEAVGRGDFSRRIEQFSNDECGELAQAFNRMTTSLQSSRAELERAMQQVRTTQEQLIQSEKLSAVGQFVAGVAHELNNPLTAVVGFSELLQSMPVDEKIRGHLDRIAKSAHRCHKIVHSLLSFARQHTPERKLVNLSVVIEEVLEIMAYDLRTSNVTVVREFAPELPQVMADAHQLQQVLVNILGNARQAMESFQREGRVVIRTREEDNRVLIEFQDNGPGIKPEHLARIFDPFFTTKPVGKGTGLGLSLCYGIIQEHGGRIFARSEPGEGAVFVIELPVAADGAGTAALRGASIPPFPAIKRPPSGKTILVIDDEAWILELAAELLRAEGHTVETAVGGQQAMELLARRKYDVIVSDWKMPGLNGIRLYEHLRATDPTAANRVVFMTGDVVSETFQEFLRTHQLTCLSKPFATGEFRAAVAKVSSGAKS
jgi:two-component system, NtrC family, sensor kinase